MAMPEQKRLFESFKALGPGVSQGQKNMLERKAFF